MGTYPLALCLVFLLSMSGTIGAEVSGPGTQVSLQSRREILALARMLRRASKGRGRVSAAEVQGRLLSVANRSPEERAEVIGTILKTLKAPGVRDHIGYDSLWLNACTVLGELKATEAIDFLLSRLGASNGIASLTYGSRPAAYGLVLIGEPAVPKIAEALNNPNGCRSRACRVEAIMTLGDIDVQTARDVLTDLAKTDADLRPLIEAELRPR